MEKWNGFCEAAKNSSWKVKLSAVVMGGGQLLYGCWQKGLVYLLVELSVLYYFITRGISDLVGFFTLGTQKADPWTGTAGDNSVVMLLMGIFAWIVIAVFLCIYVSNLKDAYAIERRVKAGEQPISFKAELAQLLDRKFYITALALPVLGVCVFNILPIVFMILIAFTNYGGSIVPPELVDWVGFQNFAQLTTLSRFAPTFFSIRSYGTSAAPPSAFSIWTPSGPPGSSDFLSTAGSAFPPSCCWPPATFPTGI